MNLDYKDQFNTHDLALAAALVECGYPLSHLDRSNPRRVVFVFDDSTELAAIVVNYWHDDISVNPKSYFDTLKHLKTRIYSG
jgi:hypothetical protein